MDYITENRYQMYLITKAMNEVQMEAYISECLAIAEGSDTLVQDIRAINEGVVDRVKEIWNKVKTWVKNVWAKFMEKFNHLAMREAEYLKKYKDIIMNRKPIDATYNMLDYPLGIERCTKVIVPKLNYSAMKANLDKEDPGKFLKTLIREYDGKTDPTVFINEYFVGGSRETQEIHVSKLKFADMYDFCVDYQKIVGILERDRKAIDDSANEAIRAVESIKATPAAPAAATGTNTGGSTQPTAAPSESAFDLFFDGAQSIEEGVYSEVLGYIHEDDLRTVNDDSAGSGTANNASKSTAASNGVSANKASSNMANPSDNNGTPEQRKAETVKAVAGDKDTIDETERQKVLDQINVYQTIATGIMSAKLSAAEGAMSTYSKILRAHIKDHVGNKNSDAGNNTARTNYSAGRPQPAPANNQ